MADNGPADTVVAVRGLVKQFARRGGGVTTALNHVSLELRRGEFLVLLGPSGCGKTTLLRCIAGLENPDDGEIEVHGKLCFSRTARVPAERRSLSMVFQSYALWPHMTVFDNVAYPLRNSRPRRPKSKVTNAVEKFLELTRIGSLAKQYPSELSGGQQQRVALARALVTGTGVVLFDEPLSNVDAKVRDHLRGELLAMQAEVGFAGVYVTHDQGEALAIGDRVVVMEEGNVVQIGEPHAVYDAPTSRYVANFVGKVNEISGYVTSTEGVLTSLDTALGVQVGLSDATNFKVGAPAVALWRPEDAVICPSEPVGDNAYSGTIRSAVFQGPYIEYDVLVGESILHVQTDKWTHYEVGQKVWLAVAKERVKVLRT